MSRSEQAYRHLTDGLLRGRWQPGDTLSTYALAEELAISRSPIIEALKRLQSEGLVEILPQVGCRVVRPNAAVVQELYALRAVVEGLAVSGAAERISERELRELHLLLSRLEGARKHHDRGKFDDLNHQFHSRITHASRMPLVDQITQSLWSRLRFQVAQVPTSADQMAASTEEHRAIVDALEQRSAAGARAAVEEHAAAAGDRLRTRMADATEGAPGASDGPKAATSSTD